MVLVGGDDSWMVADMLKENNVAVILGRIHSLPPREDDDVDLPYKLPYLLKQAGVEYAISIEGSWNTRNLGFMCGTSAGYGLTKEEALMSITSAPAKILGIDKTVGTLETGKDATLFISTGDALDMKSQHVEAAFIRGKEINLDNVQKQLNVKYREKYGLK
jgi:imidazolonepropionase-like amidohydrolase